MMTKKEEQLVAQICGKVNSPLKSQIETVARSVITLQAKLEENSERYMNEPLSVQIVKGDGEIIDRTNPFVQEYRSMLKDYMAAIKQLQELTNAVGVEKELNALVDMKEKFKIAKPTKCS